MFPAMPAAALWEYPCASRKLTIAVTLAGSMPREVSHVSAVVAALAGAFAAVAVAAGAAGAFAADAAALDAAALFASAVTACREALMVDAIASARPSALGAEAAEWAAPAEPVPAETAAG